MKLKTRMFVGVLAFLMSVCTLIPQAGAMVSDDDEEVPADLGGVGAIARDSLVVFGPRLPDPQQQLFVAARAGNLAAIIDLIKSGNVHTRFSDAKGDTIWHILVGNKKWGVIKKLLKISTTEETVQPNVVSMNVVINRCRQSFADCINRRNSQGKTPYDLACDNHCESFLKSSIPGDLPPNLNAKLPVGLKRWR